MAKLAEAENEWLEFESQRRKLDAEKMAVEEKQRVVLYRRLRLRKKAGLLRKREKTMFARELKNINRLNRLKRETAALSEVDTGSEPVVLLTTAVSAPDLFGFDSPAVWLEGGILSN